MELKREGINLPEKVLAMQLIDSASLLENETQLVLTGIDYENDAEMFYQAVRALRKFFGGQLAMKRGVGSSQIKEENVNSVDAEDVNYNRSVQSRGNNYNRGRSGYSYNVNRGYSGGTYNYNNNRSFSRQQSGQGGQ